MSTISKIMRMAAERGACNKTGKVSDIKTMSWLFFSPQGLEFCEKENFPSIELFRELDKEDLLVNNILVDAGPVHRSNDVSLALIGDTRAELIFDDPTRVHKVVIMHGAKVTLVLSNYAVVRLVNIGNNMVDIRKDRTSVVLK